MLSEEDLKSPEIIEAARFDAWFTAGHRSVTLPDGWPDGIDPEGYVRRHAEKCCKTTDTNVPVGDTPLVKRFRQLINGG